MAKSYSAAIEEIKSRANIVDVINSVVPLKKAGINYKGLCPFHNEKTASFMVSEERQIFNCFGCGAKGDVIEFTKKYYNITFAEAVEKLAAQYGIEIQDLYSSTEQKKDPYYEANRLAARFFYDSFAGNKNPGFAYMQKRQIRPDILQKFGIGYADGQWTSLTDHLKKNGITDEMLVELGLSSQKNGRVYDKFRDRVMFPIINTKGKVIGFGGRILGDGEPKYLNSPESLVFQKKYNLFGLNLTRTEIQKEGFAILVEGYMDVVALYQAGVRNVGASLGTALTENQAKLLKRYTDKVVLCYDADSAGINAALRGIDILRAAGLDVKVLHVDEGKDPDEYVKKHGKDDFLAMMNKKAVADVDYKVSLIAQKYDIRDTVQAVKFLKAVANVLRELSPVEADLYIKKIASQFHISEGALRREVEIGGQKTVQLAETKDAPVKEEGVPPDKTADRSSTILEQTLIRLSLIKSEYFKGLSDYPECIVTPEGSAVFGAMSTLYSEDKEFEVQEIRDCLDDSTLKYFNGILSDIRIGEKDAESFNDCIAKLKNNRLSKRADQIKAILETAGQEDPAALNSLMKELAEIQKELKKR